MLIFYARWYSCFNDCVLEKVRTLRNVMRGRIGIACKFVLVILNILLNLSST